MRATRISDTAHARHARRPATAVCVCVWAHACGGVRVGCARAAAGGCCHH